MKEHILKDILQIVKNWDLKKLSKGDIYFKNALKTEEGADIDGYIKRVNKGKINTDEDIAIEEIVETEKSVKPKVVPVTHHKEAV